MLVDDGVLQQGDRGWQASRKVTHVDIPPTIHALLAARLDRLAPEERDVLQRASIAGKIFWRSAVVELSPADLRPTVGAHLHSLLRKKLIFPEEQSSFPGEDGFRFAHLLVRDAAYRSIPKSRGPTCTSASPTGCCARPASASSSSRRSSATTSSRRTGRAPSSGPVDDRGRELASRAGSLLGHAGRRAFARSDMPAALEAARPLDLARDRGRPDAARADARALERVLDGRRADPRRGPAERADRDGARGRRPAARVVRAARARVAAHRHRPGRRRRRAADDRAAGDRGLLRARRRPRARARVALGRARLARARAGSARRRRRSSGRSRTRAQPTPCPRRRASSTGCASRCSRGRRRRTPGSGAARC